MFSQKKKSKANGKKQVRSTNAKNGKRQNERNGMGESSFSGAMTGFASQKSVAAAYSTGQRTKLAKIVSRGNSVRIVHRELLSSVSGSADFQVQQTYSLNPGLASSFPWLATQAQSWERYRFNKLRYCYYTRTGSNVPGSVMIVPDYDAADSAPISEQIASAYSDVAEDAPWKDIVCDLKANSLHALGPTKFIRTGVLANNLDIKTYDAGNLFLITTDGTDVGWGKLWVEYDVELFTPQLNAGGGGIIASQGINSTTPTSASMLANQVVIAGSSLFAACVGNVLVFAQAGQFMIQYFVDSSSSATAVTEPVAGAGGTVVTSVVTGSGDAAMSFQTQYQAVVGSTLTYDNTIVDGTIANLVISQIPSNFGSIVV